MAQMIPTVAPYGCNPGERAVFNALRANLPSDDYFVWFDPTIFGSKNTARPDFVILSKEFGIVIIEVKDIDIGRVVVKVNESGQWVIGQGDYRSNPEKQVLQHLDAIRDQIRNYKHTHPDKYNLLLHQSGPHKGKFMFPVSHLVAFPNTNKLQWEQSGLANTINPRNVLVRDDLGSGIKAKISEALFFTSRLTQEQANLIKWMLFPEIRTNPEQLSLLDVEQANLVIADTSLPPQQEKLVTDFKVNLVRGVVGSGKTLVLLKRAKFLREKFPDWNILVLTYRTSFKSYLHKLFSDIGGDPETISILGFHKWCRNLLIAKGLFVTPQKDESRKALLKKIMTGREPSNFSLEFLLQEFDWIKERIPYVNWKNYPNPDRTSRVGRKRGLGINEREKRRQIFEIFEEYQKNLHNYKMRDWADVPVDLLRALDNGEIESQCYDAILVDEAQDFAPIWFSVILRMIKPKTGTLLIVGDGAQKIYRNDITWKEIGIAAKKGNTTILRKSYRSTHEILNAAIEVIRNSQNLLDELSENGDSIIEPDQTLKHGPLPILMCFENQADEANAVSQEILRLLQQGYLPQHIAILHRHKARHEGLASALRHHGIPVKIVSGDMEFLDPTVKMCTLHSIKGMEFDVVFVCGLDDFNESNIDLSYSEDMEEALERERKLLYVGMTRARTQLYITYSGIEPEWVIRKIEDKFELRNRPKNVK